MTVYELADVLVRFRWNRIAITADIEKVFLMIGIHLYKRIRETCKHRFLWLKDPRVLNSEVIQLQFCRLVFRLRPSPSILGATLKHHLDAHRDSHAELVELIKKSLYVDDLLNDADNVQDRFELYQESKELMVKGAFNL